jgi:cation diffusion facilitator CzcD-associated flavoprotein CzcO
MTTTDERTAPGSAPISARPLPDHVRVAIVGAGFAGIGSAVRLREHGIHDFVLLERADSVGGTWRDNTYPGCACDVPSHLYSFSFAPNPDWSHVFSRQPEIRAYLERVTDEFGVRPHVHTSTDLVAGRWDDDAMLWRLETTGAADRRRAHQRLRRAWSSRAPDVPGSRHLRRPAFHSPAGDHDVDLTGKRVAVIGNRASAIQFVPAIAPSREAPGLQRTAAVGRAPRNRPEPSRLERSAYPRCRR